MGSKSTSKKKGLETKNKVGNNKIKITRTYKNENEPQHIFFFIHFFLLFLFFSFWTFSFYTLMFLFYFIVSIFLFSSFFSIFTLFFSFQQLTRKWNDANKGTFIKQSTNSPHLSETHSQNNSKAPFLPKV